MHTMLDIGNGISFITERKLQQNQAHEGAAICCNRFRVKGGRKAKTHSVKKEPNFNDN